MFRQLFGRSKAAKADPAAALYSALVAQARRPEFYTSCGVPDTVQGRFEMIALHAFLVLRRLRTGAPDDARLAQDLFDLMFADMDRNLRELGVGDLGVGKRVKALAKSFYGRIAAYDQGLDGAPGTLEAALARNVYAGSAAADAARAALADYLRRAAAAMTCLELADLHAGRVSFAPLPATAS